MVLITVLQVPRHTSQESGFNTLDTRDFFEREIILSKGST